MTETSTDFIRQRIERDLADGVVRGTVVTRFPPEPNGYLHIGHAKSICLNFGVAREFGGCTFLRFDDTNPLRENEEYVAAIERDVAWLGFDWQDRLTFASDYFEPLYEAAVGLVRDGKAYVCSLSQQEIRATRGTLTQAGTDSPYRERSIKENLDLLERMRQGEFPDGAHVLRAKIDMASPNINMRDPVLYRIRHTPHQRTGDAWVIYPTYDFTHCICDALEGITHSICTLEFEDHRPLYDWVLDNTNFNFHPPQIEFARLGLEYTLMSKRLLQRLVDEGRVDGWDDPRMPTLAGLRRRGVTPAAIRDFCRRVGVTKQDSKQKMELLEFCIRSHLEAAAPRGMAVLRPIKVRITNYSGGGEILSGPWHSQRPELGSRNLAFGRELYIEQDDFSFAPPPKWKRFAPGVHVRLRYAYILRCDDLVTDAQGEVRELLCTYIPESKSGSDKSGIKPAGVIHWVAATSAVPVRVRLYDRLCRVPNPNAASFMDDLNPDSLRTVNGFVEPAIADSEETRFQFERLGYFCRDNKLSGTFNRIVTLRDSWRPG